MSWAGIASNQTVTFNNLQDAVNTGVFALKNTIPASNECITKSEADNYVYINAGYSSFASKSSNQLIYKADLAAPSTGVVFNASSGLYPVSGSSSSASGLLTNSNSFNVYIKGIFNSAGINSGTINNDNIYYNFPENPGLTIRIYFLSLSISSFGQSIYTNRDSDNIRPGWFILPAATAANITIDKLDGFGSGSTLRLAWSLTPTGTYTTI